jgi:alkylation response protein AidB-like acyl-CoA dehydrogenase
MSYFMNEEQLLIQKSVHEFCQNPETQKAIAADTQQHGFPWNSWKLLAEIGYIGVFIPEEYGGQGRDMVTQLIILEALGTYAYPCLEALAGHTLGMTSLYYWGTEEQKKKYLPQLASGKQVCCGAATDPAGSFNMSEWGLTYTKDGDDYVLNGSKVLVTNADAADIKFIFAQDEAGIAQNRIFIVEKGTPGLETGFQEARIIPGADDWGTITMKNVRVPSSNCLQDNGFGFTWVAIGFNMGAMMLLGLGQAAFGMAFNYTSQRTNSGRPLTALQSVSHRLVDIAINNELTKSIVYNAARLWDEERFEESARLSFMAKAFAGEAMTKNVHDATVLHGGVGYSPKSVIGVINAMAVSAEIAEGCPDIMRDFIAGTYGIEPVWKKGRP